MSENTSEEAVVERAPQVRADGTTLAQVLAAIMDGGEGGASLKTISAKTGLRYRVCSNLAWKLEGSPDPHVASETYMVPRKPDERVVERVPGKGATFRLITA